MFIPQWTGWLASCPPCPSGAWAGPTPLTGDYACLAWWDSVDSGECCGGGAARFWFKNYGARDPSKGPLPPGSYNPYGLAVARNGISTSWTFTWSPARAALALPTAVAACSR